MILFTLFLLTTIVYLFIKVVKAYPRAIISILAIVAVVAFFTKPSEESYFNSLAKKHDFQCYDYTICTSSDGTRTYTVKNFSAHDFVFFTIYKLDLGMSNIDHLFDIDSIGAFYGTFVYTFR